MVLPRVYAQNLAAKYLITGSERRCCQIEDSLRDWPVDLITDSSDELIDLTLDGFFELLAAEKLLLMCLHYARTTTFRIRFVRVRESYQ